MKDRAENEEGFYSYEQSGLGKQQGYYIYYEKNEKMKKYASKELELYRKIFIEGPIAPVTTSDFLSQDEYFTFWKTPPELGGEEFWKSMI